MNIEAVMQYFGETCEQERAARDLVLLDSSRINRAVLRDWRKKRTTIEECLRILGICADCEAPRPCACEV